MSLIIGWCFIGMLVGLMVNEGLRFRRARLDSEEIPYPAIRLRRRLLIGALLILAVLDMWGLVYYSQGTPISVRLALITLLPLMLMCFFYLWWRDMAEASAAAVAHARRMDAESGKQLLELNQLLEQAKSDGQTGRPADRME